MTEADLLANPADLDAWSVYADQLIEGGDAEWGTWIALHLAVERGRPTGPLKIAESGWLSFLGVASPADDVPDATEAARTIATLMSERGSEPARYLAALIDGVRHWLCHVRLVHGFVATASFSVDMDHPGDLDFTMLADLITGFAGRFLRRLEIEVRDHNHTEYHLVPILEVLAGSRPRVLETIAIHAIDQLPTERDGASSYEVTDAHLAALFAAAPRLATLDMRWRETSGGRRLTYGRGLAGAPIVGHREP